MIYNTTKFRCDRCGHEDEIGAIVPSHSWDEIMRDNDLHFIHGEIWCGPCVRGEKPALNREAGEHIPQQCAQPQDKAIAEQQSDPLASTGDPKLLVDTIEKYYEAFIYDDRVDMVTASGAQEFRDFICQQLRAGMSGPATP